MSYKQTNITITINYLLVSVKHKKKARNCYNVTNHIKLIKKKSLALNQRCLMK